LLQAWWTQQPRPRLRLLGVGLSGFGERAQNDLFQPVASAPQADGIQDRINEKFGAGSLVRAGVLKTRE